VEVLSQLLRPSFHTTIVLGESPPRAELPNW
jgi:hypothetical protein